MPRNVSEHDLWISFAKEDLASARILIDAKISFRNAGYLCQQATEKVIKACFIYRSQLFPKSHNLEFLRNQLEGGWLWKEKISDLSMLTEFAIEARYPGDWEEVTEEEAQNAYILAESVFQHVLKEIGS